MLLKAHTLSIFFSLFFSVYVWASQTNICYMYVLYARKTPETLKILQPAGHFGFTVSFHFISFCFACFFFFSANFIFVVAIFAIVLLLLLLTCCLLPRAFALTPTLQAVTPPARTHPANALQSAQSTRRSFLVVVVVVVRWSAKTCRCQFCCFVAVFINISIFCCFLVLFVHIFASLPHFIYSYFLI